MKNYSPNYNLNTGDNLDINSLKHSFKDKLKYKSWLFERKELFELYRSYLIKKGIPYDEDHFDEIARNLDDSVIARHSDGYIITDNIDDFISSPIKIIEDEVIVKDSIPTLRRYVGPSDHEPDNSVYTYDPLYNIDWYMAVNPNNNGRSIKLLQNIHNNTDCGTILSVIGYRKDKDYKLKREVIHEYLNGLSGGVTIDGFSNGDIECRMAITRPRVRSRK